MAEQATGETGVDVAAIRAAMDEATPGPWQVCLTRPDGQTLIHVNEHTHASLAVDRDCFPDEYDPPTDADGYNQPDEAADIPDYKLGVARFVMLARQHMPALLAAAEERDRLRERLRELCEDAAVFEAMMAGRGDVVTDVTARELRREITLTRVALNGGAAAERGAGR